MIVETLQIAATKVREKVEWQPIEYLVAGMVLEDRQAAECDGLVRSSGYGVMSHHE